METPRRSRFAGRASTFVSLAGLAAVLLFTIGLRTVPAAGQDPPPPTAKDGVYTKAQAEAGKALFDKTCSTCHAFKPWEKSDQHPDLAGEAFLERWNGKSIKELTTLIFSTMPNDGSMFLDEKQSLDLTAYILMQNGFPAGEQPLAADEAAGRTRIVK
jgi:mono/diheme cytochrome c family protein